MSRLQQRFRDCARAGRAALVPYITAGDPEPGLTVELLLTLAGAGADVIELGVPFSDPMAEGPTIQRACERALRHHVSLRDVLGMVREFRARDSDTPVVLMGYLNPLEAMGYGEFAAAAGAAGVDGVITVDMPPEEAAEYRAALTGAGLDPVFLLSPTSSDERIARICADSGGFVYYVSLRGVTGAGNLDVDEVRARIDHVRRFTDLPVGVGFGIEGAESAARVAQFADAVIVGSAIVRRIEALADRPGEVARDLGAFVAQLRAAIEGARHSRAVGDA